MLYYVPLERYKSRYTFQLSAPIIGWLERKWIKHDIEYERIDGLTDSKVINTGMVLDVATRTSHCFTQVNALVKMAERGELKNDDVIYFDDFWHFGIEALPYMFCLSGIKPKIFAFLYAQSVDEFDFTYPMRKWMCYFENGIGAFLDGIFVANTLLKELVADAKIMPLDKIHVVGLPFDSEEVKQRMTNEERNNQIVYASRWDAEKNPLFFLEVARKVIKKTPDAKFVVCTGNKTIKSNKSSLLGALHEAINELNGQLVLLEDLSKEEYYRELCRSKIQFNCAYQDWVSFTLLEASSAGCFPIYPSFRSFPETLLGHEEFLYPAWNVDAAVDKIVNVLARNDLWSNDYLKKREWIHSRYDWAWLRMASIMGLKANNLPIDWENQVTFLYQHAN